MIELLVLSASLGAGCASGVDVRPTANKTFDIEAKGASLSSILQCLSDRAGFKLVIDPGVGAGQPITLNVQNRTPSQGVSNVLEGLAVNYALATDPVGDRVVMLLITGRSGSSGGSSSGSPGGSSGATAFTPPGSSSRPPAGSTAPRRTMPFVPPENIVAPQTDDTQGGQSFLYAPPAPLYPEPQPLSPLSLRGGRRIHVADRDARAQGTPRSGR